MKKIKTAFIFKSSNPYMSKTAWATTYYNFFMTALNRHPELEMSYFPAEKKFDISKVYNFTFSTTETIPIDYFLALGHENSHDSSKYDTIAAFPEMLLLNI